MESSEQSTETNCYKKQTKQTQAEPKRIVHKNLPLCLSWQRGGRQDTFLFPGECCRVLAALHDPPTGIHTETHSLSTGEALQG